MRAGDFSHPRDSFPPETPRVPRPRFALSSRSSPLLSADMLSVIADQSAMSGVELDLTGSAWRHRFIRPQQPHVYESVTSLWLPATTSDDDAIVSRIGRLYKATIIIDEEPGKQPNGQRQLAKANRVRSLTPPGTRVALAIRPRNPGGNRAHLGQISLLRHVAEEWDLDVAIDLCGHIDWLWEAEAVVQRLSTRLRLVRMLSPLPRFDGHTRTRITQRTIAACIDTAFAGQVSVVCPLPFWRWRDPFALDRSFATAVDRLNGRFGVFSGTTSTNIVQRSSMP